MEIKTKTPTIQELKTELEALKFILVSHYFDIPLDDFQWAKNQLFDFDKEKFITKSGLLKWKK